MSHPFYPHMFEPLKIGNMIVPNRICHVPTDISSANADGSVSERDIHHHSQIAKGGTGLIIVGATTPDAATGRPTVTCLVADNDNFIPGLTRLAYSMHKYGAKCVVQLQHPGRQCAIPRYNTMSTNDMVIQLPWSAGHEVVYENQEEKGKAVRGITTEECLDMIEKFSDAAWRVKQAGFDGVELHAAHGYLISQFMSPYLNRRNDRFGGSFENRMRFPLAIIASIQKKCGKDFPVLVRYSIDEFLPGSRRLDESILVAQEFEKAGVACLDLSCCIQETPGAGFCPMQYDEGWQVEAAAAVKQAVSIPTICNRVLRNPDYCDKILKEGKADMVGLSRQMLADPYWPIKAAMGKTDEIRRCISCLTGCWQESMMAKREIQCAINPACGHMEFDELKPAPTPMNVAVVGGGPAGMEAARIATVRGHKVTIFEKTGELGGAILGCCVVPGKQKMKWYADWIRTQIKKLGVTVKLNQAPAIEELKGYDIILNATGASSYMPDVIGADHPMVIPFEKVVACPKRTCEYNPGDRQMTKVGERVLLWGDHFAAVDTAEFLASIGKEVFILTDKKELGSDLEVCHMYVTRKNFEQTHAEGLEDQKTYKHPVKVFQSSTIYQIKDGAVVIMDKDFNKFELAVDNVVNCHVKPNQEFFRQMLAAGLPVVNAGDSVAVRNLHAAVDEGALFGLKLDEKSLIWNPNHAVMNDLPLDVYGMLTR